LLLAFWRDEKQDRGFQASWLILKPPLVSGPRGVGERWHVSCFNACRF